ncbi:RNA polymerase sigma-I factor [Desulfallas thermosapovorans]|uniref:RNA polymerase sigma factor SigI n=1 Tax=Desulfallas thermosapovorans DSM 6562 TaxID=1121431 RepID=A0A5S4ZXW7_9FIRM|nr:RNA polymerase sigma-I factor [Desulfallas thermosapovorans]TYO97931.1 RNA polymerase sigma factor [Desulfallas thermosapovorans DSM 6562]
MLFGDEVEVCLQKIREGDESSREKLIAEAKPFIAGVVGRLCGRSLSWDHDDELSIGLIAFNEAIERFKEKMGVPFTAFARMVIRSRVTDYLRKESRWNRVDLHMSNTPLEGAANQAENDASWEQYIEQTAQRERIEEINNYNEKISNLGITFKDLVKSSPKHRDTRQTLIRAAYYIVEHGSLYETLRASKRLPLRELEMGTGISRKVLERGRKYIIGIATLLYYREEFIYLNSYVRLPQGEC